MHARSRSILGLAFLVVVACVAVRVEAAAPPKTVVKCQATLEKSGAAFVQKKIGALTQCANGVFKCIETVDDATKRSACIEKARGGCGKSLAAITAARAALVAAVSSACATLDPGQVTGADGLGYAAADCSAYGVTVTDVASLAACLAAEHNCLASRAFERMVPRALELLQFTPPAAVVPGAADADALACLDDDGGTGADVDDAGLGKAIVKCEAAIEKAGTKLASGRAKGLAKCVDALFTCSATKTGADLDACRTKARMACATQFTKLDAQATALGNGLDKPCGDATLFAALKTPAGADFDAFTAPTLVDPTFPRSAAARAGLPLPAACNVLLTRADLYACVRAIITEILDELKQLEAPRAPTLLGDVGCGLGSCGAAPTPQPTSTPGGGGIGGPIRQIIDFNGDGQGHQFLFPHFVATDGSGTAYVTGYGSNNLFKVTADGTITLVMQDSQANPLSSPSEIAVDGTTVYVIAEGVAYVYKIAGNAAPVPLIGTSGDGTHSLSYASAIAVDGNHNVYVGARGTNNVFKIVPGGAITQILDATGDGTHAFSWPGAIAIDDAGNVYVTGETSNNAFKISSIGTITQLVGPTGDGQPGHTLNAAIGVAVQHDTGTAYVSGFLSNDIFRITANGTVTQFVGPAGDGTHAFGRPVLPRARRGREPLLVERVRGHSRHPRRHHQDHPRRDRGRHPQHHHGRLRGSGCGRGRLGDRRRHVERVS